MYKAASSIPAPKCLTKVPNHKFTFIDQQQALNNHHPIAGCFAKGKITQNKMNTDKTRPN